ncbi:DUF362 domain-containing protein [candidate division KSB1 bacterium]|nr:DUF362 domain-containing protein [candidate division KSB1 bacterium]
MSKKSTPPFRPCQMANQSKNNISRRRFFGVTGLAAAGVLAGACGKNPASPDTKAALLQQPVSPVSGSRIGSGSASSKVATATVNNYNYQALKENIQASFEALGGLGDIIKPGDTVGFKLNMTGGASTARKTPRDHGESAEELYWTHPEILKVVGELVKDAGAGKIYVMEANYDWESVTDWGYEAVVNYLGAEYIDLNKAAPYGSFVEKQVPDPLTHWDFYYHNGVFYDLDCFISLPKTKRHYGAGMTNAMKNMIGSVPGSKYATSGGLTRTKFHQADSKYAATENLVRTIVDLNRIRPIHLAVCDAIKTADNGEGPWNDGFKPVTYNTLITSKDPVAADAVGTVLFGFDPTATDKTGAFAVSSLPGNWDGTDNYLRIADELGMGTHDPAKIEVVDVTVNTGVVKRG